MKAVLLAAVLVSLCQAGAPRHTEGATFTVSGSGYTSLDGGTTQTPFNMTNTSNSDGSKSVSGEGDSHAYTVGVGGKITHQATGSGSAFAGPGLLRVQVDTVAFIDALPFYQPRVLSSFGANFADSFTVHSSTLPVGAPTDYRITLRVDVDHNNPVYYEPEGFPHGTFNLSLYFGTNGGVTYNFPVNLGGPTHDFPPNLHFEQQLMGQAKVGDSVPIYLSIGASAQEWVKSGNGIIYQTHIDASHTVKLFVDPLTPGVTLLSDSGHDYSIPEPQATALAVIGLLCLGRRAVKAGAGRLRKPGALSGPVKGCEGH